MAGFFTNKQLKIVFSSFLLHFSRLCSVRLDRLHYLCVSSGESIESLCLKSCCSDSSFRNSGSRCWICLFHSYLMITFKWEMNARSIVTQYKIEKRIFSCCQSYISYVNIQIVDLTINKWIKWIFGGVCHKKG